MATSHTALYTSLIKEINLSRTCLGDPHIARFFLNDVDKAFSRKNVDIESYEELQEQFRTANKGSKTGRKSLEFLQELAYARKGPARKPIITKLYPIPSGHKKEHFPPPPSPVLFALLTSSLAMEKPIMSRFFDYPPNLPEKADISSRDFSIVGPICYGLEKNMRYRFIAQALSRLRLPLPDEEVKALESIVQGSIINSSYDKQYLSKRASILLNEIPIPKLRKSDRNQRYFWEITLSPWAASNGPRLKLLNQNDLRFISKSESI